MPDGSWAAGAKVVMVGHIHGQTTNNVLHFGTDTQINDEAAGDALVLALLVAFLECVSEQLVGAVTSDWTLQHVEGTRVYQQVRFPIVKVPETAVVGTLSPASHSFASSLVSIRSTTGGKSGQGRIFLPPPGETETTSSLSAQSVQDELVAFVTCLAGKFIGASATTDWRLGVFSDKLAQKTYTNWNVGFHSAVSMVPKREQAIISRRKVGRGI